MNSISVNIDLNFKDLVKIVKKLSPSEKQKLNDAIWEGDMQIPIEQQKLVLDRVAQSADNPERLLDWDECVKTLKA